MSPLEHAVYEIVRKHPGWHAPRVAAALNRPARHIYTTLQRMRERGYVRSKKRVRPVLRLVRCYEVRPVRSPS